MFLAVSYRHDSLGKIASVSEKKFGRHEKKSARNFSTNFDSWIFSLKKVFKKLVKPLCFHEQQL
jgi:hypothetical protein